MNPKPAKFSILILVTLVFLLISFGIVFAQEGFLLYFQDFESGWPEEWEAESGWEITKTELGSSLTGSGHNWVYLNTGAWDDYHFQFDVKVDETSLLHANFRLADGSSRYFIGLSHNSVYLSKQTGPDQFSEFLIETNGIGSGWHSVEIAGYGPEIIVFVDEQEVISFADPNPIFSGGIAFESIMEGRVWIDNIEIRGDGEAASQTLNESEGKPDNQGVALGDLSWVRLGGPPGGLGYDIRYNFADPNIWYVTDANAGVHISTDNGLTWNQSNTGIDTVGGPAGDGIPVFSLTVDPHNPQIIWIGTDLTGDIYKSIDGGATWVKKSQGVIHEYDVIQSIRGFTVDPRTSDIVYAMGELQRPGNNVWGLGVGGVIYKTVDGGENWTRIWYGEIPSSLARYMWIHPDNPDILYVSTGIFDRGAVGETDPETDPTPFGGLGVLKSTDGGSTWQVLGKENGLDFRYIGSLYMHPDEPDTLFAAAGHIVSELASQKMKAENHSPLGIYRTTDGGETWQQVLKPEGNILDQVFSAVEICPGNSDILYAGSEAAVYRSEDGGNNWALMAGSNGTWGPPGVRAGWPIDMQCDPNNPDRVFANNYSGGNFYSEDGGKTWKNASNGYSGAQIIGVAVNPLDPAHVFAVGRSGGWESTDAGASWSGIHNPGDSTPLAPGDWGGVAFDPLKPGHVILGSENFLNWNPQENQWHSKYHQCEYGPETSEIEFAPSDSNIVYAVSANHNSMIHSFNYSAGGGIILSRDGGYSWQTITGEQFSNAILTDVAVDPLDPKVVYVAAQTGFYKSSDSGESWVNSVITAPGESVRTVAVHPSDSNLIYAGLPGKGVYLSDDWGDSWRQVFAGLEPNGDYRDIIFDPTDPDTIYLSDILSGVYQSRDRGETWSKLIQGLTNRAATSLALSSDGLHLYTGTAGGGVFRLDLNGTPPEIVNTEPEVIDAPEDPPPTVQAEDEETPVLEEISIQDVPATKRKILPCLSGISPMVFAGLLVFYKRKRP